MNSEIPAVAGESYIGAARQGRHTWPRYLMGVGLVAFMWLIVGSTATALTAALVMLALGDISQATIFQLLMSPPPELMIPAFIVLMVSFVPFFLGVLGVVRFLHQRPVRTVVTGQPRIDWRRVGVGFGVWLALAVATTLIDMVARPGMYTVEFNPGLWLPYALLALLFIPIQAGTEELFFRGYLMQAASVISRHPLWLMVPSSLLFAALHLANPEISVNLPVVASFYLLFALFAAWISLKDGTIELALGMHIANNLTAVLVTFPESAIPAPAPILKHALEPVLDLTIFLLAAAIFYIVVFGFARRRTARQPAFTE